MAQLAWRCERKAPVFLCILALCMISSNWKSCNSIGITVMASEGNHPNTYNMSEDEIMRTIILAGSSLSSDQGSISISGNSTGLVIIAPCSEIGLHHIVPHGTYGSDKDTFPQNSSDLLEEMACWRSLRNIITLQLHSGTAKTVATDHRFGEEETLCGAFLCWPDHIESINSTSINSKDTLPLRQINGDSVLSTAIATSRGSASAMIHCRLIDHERNFSLLCWGNQFGDGEYLAPVFLHGSGFQIIHPDVADTSTVDEKGLWRINDVAARRLLPRKLRFKITAVINAASADAPAIENRPPAAGLSVDKTMSDIVLPILVFLIIIVLIASICYLGRQRDARLNQTLEMVASNPIP